MTDAIKFYKETNFKETPIGKIPKEWKVASLEEISTEIRTGPFGSQLRKSELAQSGVRVYTQENILKKNFSIGNLYISQTKFEKLKNMKVKPGDVLLTIRGSTGAAAIFPEGAEKGIIHTNLAIVRTKKELLLPEYLYFLINDFPLIKFQIERLSSATTLGALYAKHIKKIKIPLPLPFEQERIVEVLFAVDLAIEKVDEAIVRVERLKKSLMQQLLTKGIGHKEFKETPIGKMPKTWETVKVTNLVNVLKGFAFSSKFFNDKKKGIPLLRIRDLGKSETETYYSGTYDQVYIVKKGDILISMDGEFNAYIWNGPTALLNQRVCKIWSKNPLELNNLFLYYQIQKPLKIIEQQVSQTTVKHLLDSHMERIILPLPPIVEQQKIAEILYSVDSVLRLKKDKKEKLVRMKRRLMDLLLTGKVRVVI